MVYTLLKGIRNFANKYSQIQAFRTNKFPSHFVHTTMATNGDSKNSNMGEEKLSQAAIDRKARKEREKQAKMEKYTLKKQQEEKKKISETGGEQDSSKKKEKGKELEIVEYKWNHPPGERKDTSRELPTSFTPKYIEAAWYEWWEKQGFFKPEYGRSLNTPNPKGTFMICIPPPNVTGSLHLGHALTDSIEDAVVRWQRARGKTTLWNPGCDHAGIATQVVVEKKLKKDKNLSRHDIGREGFVKEVWAWKEEKGERIYNQIKRLGASCDWDRAFFTMESKLYTAVTESFIRLHREGLIYRANRLVNWSCQLRSAISDIEVDKKELTGRTPIRVPNYEEPVEFGILVTFAYPVIGGGEIVVATTRPETMLGDTAVAVHPTDSRYSDLIGKSCQHPFLPRKLPIIADEAVNKDFGTGAVKITPAHDHNDYEMGKRHQLEFVEVIDQYGMMREECGPAFANKKRFDCRKLVIDGLKEKGLYRDTVDNEMVVPICSRSKDIIEPLLKPQWYLNCDDMSREAVQAVRSGRIKLIPSSHEKTWYSWMENCRHWCISRQLWWGHRIPAYFVSVEGEATRSDLENEYWVSGRTEDEARAFAANKFKVPPEKIHLRQDEDVLDTWYSSGLLPISIFGWPNIENNTDFKHFFPGSLLETGHDILFFWVARMVMFSLKLAGDVPFREVYLHAMVRDAHGRKMSKTLGNVIDPLDVIDGITLSELHKQLELGNLEQREIAKAREGQKQDFPEGIPECGTDAMRFGLCAYTAQGRDINLDIKRIVAYRHFCNKIWNAMKFIRDKMDSEFVPQKEEGELYGQLRGGVHAWIMSRLSEAVDLVNQGFEGYNFTQATTAVYNFWLYELCDVYLEVVKPIMMGDNEPEKELTKQILYTCSDTALRLLSPFMPFLTEELFQRLPRRNPATAPPSICVTPFPQGLPPRDQVVESELETLLELVHVIRKLKSEYLENKHQPVIIVQTKQPEFASLIDRYRRDVVSLSRIEQIQVENVGAPPAGCTMAPLSDRCDVYLLVTGVVDVSEEIEKLKARRGKAQWRLDELRRKTEQPSYEKVPEAVRGADSRQLGRIEAEIEALDKVIQSLVDIDK